jgi:hypothetical protein
MKRAFVVVPALVVMGLAASTASASAATGPAPGTQRIGACNMLIAGAGMVDIAMQRDNNLHGNAGMFHAVAVSGAVSGC